MTSQRIASSVLAVYTLLLAVALFSPSNHAQSQMVLWLVRQLDHVGVPPRIDTFKRLEVLMNAAIIAPLTFLGSVVWPRLRWQEWTASAFLGAGLVETFQGLFLPHRQASFSDIVANTFGALVGALVARLVWGSRSRHFSLRDA